MQKETRVRRATPNDADVIARFNIAMALETEARTLDPGIIGPGVRAVFEKPERGFYLVAEREGSVAGCLMCTTEWSDWRNGWYWWIQSVYTAPEHRRKGVYRAMYAHLKELARESGGVRGFRLYVEKENTRAQDCYRSLAMRDAGYFIYEELV